VPSGIAVYADNTFAALKGRDALHIEWDLPRAETRSSEELAADYVRRFGEPGIVATNNGNFDEAFDAPGVQTVEAELVFPFLAPSSRRWTDRSRQKSWAWTNRRCALQIRFGLRPRSKAEGGPRGWGPPAPRLVLAGHEVRR
jgi:hypothetical protein